MQKTLVLVSGPSGVGKSTLRLQLRNELGKYFDNKIAGIDVDDVYCFIDPKFSAPNYMELWEKARKNTGSIARQLLNNGIDVVFVFGNTIFKEEQILDILGEVQLDAPVNILHFTLSPNRAALEKRLIKRQYSVPLWLDDHLAERRPYLNEQWTHLLDTSDMTPEQTLTYIYENINLNPPMKKQEQAKKGKFHKLLEMLKDKNYSERLLP